MSEGGAKRGFLLILCFAGLLLFTSLGIWQVERRAWKLDLIARVDARIHAAPVPPPAAAAWPRLDPRDYEYRRVRVRGRFLANSETLVDALTERGAGSWVLTPLQTGDGVILVNRGFVPDAYEAPGRRPAQPRGALMVTGLMRASEPGGRFLRPNEPRQERWFSRDVAAIAAARGISNAAPFFIDADAAPHAGLPIGGLTVVRFRNAHLLYALTWFGLAGLSLAGLVLLLKPAQKRR
ncbi:SURF1 family protein [Sphingomonas parva]|uniref:SURF1 family protein n=1 Tax=Sphingomonas parva TaxID=2555898 RepID=UPI001431117B|nr:SURF1 family protein [Sphingomonas parva]